MILACLILIALVQSTTAPAAPAPAPSAPATTSPATTSPVTGPSDASPIIFVERTEPAVQRIVIDPSSPPPTMPRLHGGESALTQYAFDCAARVSYEIVRANRLDDGRVQVTVRVRVAHVKLMLEDRIYLPTNADLPLRAHEEGHREIDQRVYAAAEPIARALAARIFAREFSAVAADEDAAGKAASDQAVNELCNHYLSVVAGRASRVGDEYDRITLHGTRAMNVARAVQMALDRDEKTHPATIP